MNTLHHDLQALIADPVGFIADERVEIRRMAVSLLGPAARDAAVATQLASLAQRDPEPSVRAAAAEALAGSVAPSPLIAALTDDAPEVREAATFALGEIGSAEAVPALMEVATSDGDDAVREGAVAALGAIGDDRALPLLIELTVSAPPKVRRRTVVALSAFESPDAAAAITAALGDRNPMVTEVAEMVAGAQPVDLPWPKRRH